jgi:hypothetical protein
VAGQAGRPDRPPSLPFPGNRLARQKVSHIKTCSSLMRLSARAARRTAVIEITAFSFCYGWSARSGADEARTEVTRGLSPATAGWLSRLEWTPSRFAVRRPAPHGTDAVFPAAFLPGSC